VYSARTLFGHFREALEIRIRGQALNEQMRVVRHEAVRTNRELFDRRCTTELR
jgi:uncharacterized Rmd1/YagE family protein